MHDVVLTRHAQDELEQAYDWWAENRSTRQADRWYTGFIQAMLALEQDPERFSLAPESDLFSIDVRQLHYGVSGKPTHRALFTIRSDTSVVILRVRHLAQKPLTSDEI